MLFNSSEFLGFFFVTVILGNILKSRAERIFLLLASFFFYGYTNRYFLILLLISIFIDYTVAILMNRDTTKEKNRKYYLIISLILNLGLLGYFKYTNFFLGIFNDLAGKTLFENIPIPLPVGISFYTFQSISYSVDVYNRKMEARKNFIDFALYVSFFPQLVAGPIVRAETFFRDLDKRLPVLKENIQQSFCLILIGFTRKTVFADNLGKVVDFTFANHTTLNSLELFTGGLAFLWQIYFDFAGYTDIAIGVARLFGFQFDPNFNFPMSARNIADHWNRWHISFSTWIRDYIYIPLGGSRVSTFKFYRNLIITWLFAGLWHGASYHFVTWGLWQAAMLAIHRIYSSTNICATLNEKGGRFYDVGVRIFTMFCLTLGAISFRSQTLTQAKEILLTIFFLKPNSQITSWVNYEYGILLAICFVASYLFYKNPISSLEQKSWKYPAFVFANILMLLVFAVSENKSFLYFAF